MCPHDRLAMWFVIADTTEPSDNVKSIVVDSRAKSNDNCTSYQWSMS